MEGKEKKGNVLKKEERGVEENVEDGGRGRRRKRTRKASRVVRKKGK